MFQTLQGEVEKHEDIIKDINDILAGVIQKVSNKYLFSKK